MDELNTKEGELTTADLASHGIAQEQPEGPKLVRGQEQIHTSKLETQLAIWGIQAEWELAGLSLASFKDVMNDTVTTESQGHPASRHEHKARRNDRDHGSRVSSGPAVISPHQHAGHMTEAGQIIASQKRACQ